VITGMDADKPLFEADTVQCVHCGGHFIKPLFGPSAADKKSRIGRGLCRRCNGFICGAGCLECRPTDLQLAIMEGRATGTEVSAPVTADTGLWLPPILVGVS
jgi:hypothetical protein